MVNPAWWKQRNADLDTRYVSPVRIWSRDEIQQQYTDAYVDTMLRDARNVQIAATHGWGMIIDYCTLSVRGRLYGQR